MADYPAVRIAPGSGAEFIDDMVTDRSVNGDAHGRMYFDTPKRRFTIRHVDISQTELNSLITCYTTFRGSQFTLLWIDGVTYTVQYANRPRFPSPYAVIRYDVETVLEEA